MKLNGLLYYRFYELSTWVAIYTLDFIFFLKDLNFLNKIVLCIYSIFPLKKKKLYCQCSYRIVHKYMKQILTTPQPTALPRLFS